jgi:hypothetical protein
MDLKAKLSALDNMIVNGQILESVEIFFHPNVVTMEGNEGKIEGKPNKIEHLKNFFSTISAVNGITLHSQSVGDGVTMSEFTFDLQQSDGNHILWNEVLRRQWQDGLVINERYYTA